MKTVNYGHHVSTDHRSHHGDELMPGQMSLQVMLEDWKTRDEDMNIWMWRFGAGHESSGSGKDKLNGRQANQRP